METICIDCRVGSETSMVLDPEMEVEAAQSRKLRSSRYKGVVPQLNGHWGAQIYEKHHRVWLGTFKEEDEAAKAYDIAVQRFRGKDAITNLNSIVVDDKEAAMEASFLSSHSKSEIVDMLRNHSYNDELEQSKTSSIVHQTIPRFTLNASSGSHRQHLFKKTITASDVGTLNRFVIPKLQAEKHFPVHKGNTNNSKGVLLQFEDNESKVWRFRYSYWNSSKSYVLTKGWTRFVKEKNLKAGDSVSFESSSTGPDKQFYISWKSKTGSGDMDSVKAVEPVEMLRLFGVDINLSDNGKRSGRESGLLGFGNCKEQRNVGGVL